MGTRTRNGPPKCQHCLTPMVLLRTRTVKVGNGYAAPLDDWQCKTCFTTLREGARPEHDIWINGLFVQAGKVGPR